MQILTLRTRQQKVEKRTPVPVREVLAIHSYLDIQDDGQRIPKVCLNVVCTLHIPHYIYARCACETHRHLLQSRGSLFVLNAA